jgi:hypothetical protein
MEQVLALGLFDAWLIAGNTGYQDAKCQAGKGQILTGSPSSAPAPAAARGG